MPVNSFGSNKSNINSLFIWVVCVSIFRCRLSIKVMQDTLTPPCTYTSEGMLCTIDTNKSVPYSSIISQTDMFYLSYYIFSLKTIFWHAQIVLREPQCLVLLNMTTALVTSLGCFFVLFLELVLLTSVLPLIQMVSLHGNNTHRHMMVETVFLCLYVFLRLREMQCTCGKYKKRECFIEVIYL